MAEIESAFVVKPLAVDDRLEVARMLTQEWGTTRVVSRGKMYDADRLPGFLALVDGGPAGLITYHIEGDNCEIVTLHSNRENLGIGSALIAAVRGEAIRAGCRRLWLITTNDNTHALRFYQRRGFVIAAAHVDAIAHSRRLKPEIPLLGYDGIPIRDEIEMEIGLA